MIRQNLSDTAANAALIQIPNGNTSFQYRGQGEWSTTATSGSNYTSPVYLKLSKSGDTLTASTSSDGSSWTTLASQTLHFAGAYYVGMMVDSENNSATNTATFDNFSVTGTTPTALPNGWSDTDIGSPAMPGSASYDNGTITFSVNGAGPQIWDTTDGFNFAYQQLPADGSIVAHVADAATTSSVWASAGIMIRNGLSTSDPHASMTLAKNGTTEFLSRSSTSGTTTAAYGAANDTWLKLTRSGDLFTGYTSSDGLTWTQTSSATLSMSGPVYIGLVATSGSNSDGQTIAYDHVTLTGVTPAGPAAPANLTLDFPDASYARLSWDAPSSTAGITGYNVYMSTSGSAFSLVATLTDPAATAFDLTGLAPNTPYAFHLTATGPSSTESPPASAAATSPDGIKAATDLASVAGVIDSPNDAATTLSWTNNATGILKTFIELKEAGDSNWFTLVDVDYPDTTTTATLTGLSVGGAYQARVRTITASGSAYSAPADLDVPQWQTDLDLYGEPYFATSGDVAWTSASEYPQDHTLFAHAPGTLFPDRWYGTGQISTGGLTPSANTYAWLDGHWGGVLANAQNAGYADPYEPALPNTSNGDDWVTGTRDTDGKVHLSWDAQPGYQYEIMGLGDPFQWDWTSGTFDTDTYYTDPVTGDPKEIIASENGSGGHDTARTGYFAVASSHTENGQTLYSAPSKLVDLAVAYTPQWGQAIDFTSDSLKLVWDNTAYNETGYDITRWNPTTSQWDSVGHANSDEPEWTDHDVSLNSQYIYHVIAKRPISSLDAPAYEIAVATPVVTVEQITATMGGETQRTSHARDDMSLEINEQNIVVAVMNGESALELHAVVAPGTNTSQLEWDIQRNPNDAIAAGVPTLNPDEIDPTTARLVLDLPGSSNIIVYIDKNDNRTCDDGEQLCVMHLDIVALIVDPTNVTTATPPNTYEGAVVQSTAAQFTKVVGAADPFSAQATDVLMIGGGANMRLGINKIKEGFLQDGFGSTLTMKYGTAGTSSRALADGVGPFPILDGQRANAGTGNETAYGNGPEINISRPASGGLLFTLKDSDAPVVGFFQSHIFQPATNATTATQLSGALSFCDYLSIVSTDFSFSYSAFWAISWHLTFQFDWNRDTSTWDDQGTIAHVDSSEPLNGFQPPNVRAPVWNGNTTFLFSS